jgi:hypothetical protein
LARARIAVESVRIDGKPRQRHIAYLGSVYNVDQNANYRAWWWHHMTAKLDALGNRIGAERAKIEAQLAKEVPPVTADEVTAFDLAHQQKERDEYGEGPGCYLRWPPGQEGVPPRPPSPPDPPRGEMFANTVAAVAAVSGHPRR